LPYTLKVRKRRKIGATATGGPYLFARSAQLARGWFWGVAPVANAVGEERVAVRKLTILA